MTVKTKKIMLVATALVLLCGAMVTGLFLSGGLYRTAGACSAEDDTTTDYQSQTTTMSTVTKIKTKRPEKIRGVWFTAGVDYLTDITLIEEQARNEITTKIQDIKSMGFNAVFIDWKSDTAQRLFMKNSERLSLFDLCLDSARSNNLYVVVALPLSDYLSPENENKINKNKVKDFFELYNTDAFLVTGIEALQNKLSDRTAAEIQEIMSKRLSAFHSAALASNDLLLAGTLMLDDNALAPAVIQNLNSEDNSNFILLEATTSNSDIDSKTEKLREDAQKALDDCEGKYLSGQRLDVLFSNKKKNIDITEAISGMSAAENSVNCYGIVFRSYSLIKNDTTGLGETFLKHLESLNTNGLGKVLSIYNQSSNEIKTNESKINFTGNGNPNLPLTCNGKSVETSKIGDFSADYDLTPGINKFEFKQDDTSYLYKVVYEVDILKKVEPKGSIAAPGGTAIEITAVALRDATVTATINGKALNMKQGASLDDGSEEKSPDASSDYVTYYGQYTLPKGKTVQQNLGVVSVQANYNGLNKKITGAKISVIANPPATTAAPTTTIEPTTETATTPSTEETDSTGATLTSLPSEVTDSTQAEQLTPYKYAGVAGTSKMCEIAIEHCEAMPFSPFNNASHPLTSPLIGGTFDYIDSESSYGDYQYYHLRCGKRVYRKEVKVINNGYNMPSNKVRTIKSSTKGDTIIDLALLWKVPVNVVVKGQSYPNSQNNNFAVWSFTGNCIEFEFSHTTEALGAVDVSGSNIISSAQWSTNSGSKTAVLRLYFRRAGVFYGYDISYNKDGSLRILIKNKPSATLSGYKIMLDPGHGGKDPGAICISTSPANMKYEKQINLALAFKVKERLESRGATVMMTRTDDSTVEVNDRRKMIYNKKPDLAISIHCDASKNSSAFGTSTFYYYPQSYPLANALQKQIVACYSNSIRPTNDRKSNYSRFMITRVEICPAILVEYGFISNLEECRLLQDNLNQDKLADATVQGIVNYISAN